MLIKRNNIKICVGKDTELRIQTKELKVAVVMTHDSGYELIITEKGESLLNSRFTEKAMKAMIKILEKMFTGSPTYKVGIEYSDKTYSMPTFVENFVSAISDTIKMYGYINTALAVKYIISDWLLIGRLVALDGNDEILAAHAADKKEKDYLKKIKELEKELNEYKTSKKDKHKSKEEDYLSL